MSWRARAACRGAGTVFFPEDGDFSAARAVCASCPVQAPCAVAGEREPVGMWGGKTPLERGFLPNGQRSVRRAERRLQRLAVSA